MESLLSKNFYWHRLPHYQPDNGLLFITFRLDFSISEKLNIQLSEYKQQLTKTIKPGPLQQNIIHKKVFDMRDQQLAMLTNRQYYLQDDRICLVVSETLKQLHSNLYDLFCFTIMPNHVHILIRIREMEEGVFHKLPYIMKRIKGSTAFEANKILHREGHFWEREYYDYCIRSEKEANNIVQYILMNPVKANLCKEPEDWKWTWVNHDLLA